MMETLKAMLHAKKHKEQAEFRYKEASMLRRELLEMRMERDYWKQRFEGVSEMLKKAQTEKL